MGNQPQPEETPAQDIGEFLSFSKRVLIAAGITTAVVALFALLIYAHMVFLWAFAGILLAILLRGLGDLLSRATGLPTKASVLIVTLMLVLLFSGGIALLGAHVADQLDQLTKQLPESIRFVQETYLAQYTWGQQINQYIDDSSSVLLMEPTAEQASVALGIVETVLGGLIGVIVILFLALYLGFGPEPYVNGLLRLVPSRRRDRGRDVMRSLRDSLWNWLIGMAATMTVVAGLTTLGLSLVNMEMALTLGLIAGALAFIPNFGPILGAIPGVLLSLTMEPGYFDVPMVVWVLIVYVTVQTLESYFITPLIQRQLIRIPPAMTITSQVMMGFLTGVLGVLLALPLLASVMVLIKKLYVNDTLGEVIDETKPVLE